MDNIIINLDDNIGVSEDTLPRVGYTDDIISQSDTIVGPAGPQGPAGPAGKDGEAATITVGSTTTGAAGTNAVVQNVGTSNAAILNFTIPRGDTGATGSQGPQGEQGEAGEAATITVGSVNTVASEYPATVTNSGTSSAAVLDFQIPQGTKGDTGDTGPAGRDGVDGQAATITVGSTTTGNAGTNASVTNSGTSSAAVLDFVIPRGDTGATGATGATGPAGADGRDGNDGAAATIAVGTVTTGAAGSSATVTNSGTSSAAVFDFTIPRGDTGATGSTRPAGADGQAATITVGTTTTGAAGSSATVTNSGTSSAAVLNFTIPRGDTGATGPQGPSGVGITTKTDSGGRVGYYFDDGLLICRRTVTFNVAINNSWGSLYRGVNPDFYSFAPASGTDFIEKPTVSVTALAGGTSSYWLGAWENGAIVQYGSYNMWSIPTGSLSFLRPTSSSSTPVILEIIAIGKWK